MAVKGFVMIGMVFLVSRHSSTRSLDSHGSCSIPTTRVSSSFTATSSSQDFTMPLFNNVSSSTTIVSIILLIVCHLAKDAVGFSSTITTRHTTSTSTLAIVSKGRPAPPRTRQFPSSSLVVSMTTSSDNNFDDACVEAMGNALAKMKYLSSDDFNTVFNKKRQKMVEVKPSSIPGAGLGLFAKQKIKAGTIVSFYPAHILGMEKDDASATCRISLNDETGAIEEKLYSEEEDYEHDDVDQSYLHILLGSRPLMNTGTDLFGGDLFIDVDMTKLDVPGWVGHRTNDSAVVAENSEKGVMAYYRSTRQAKNCVHVPFGPSPVLATVTTRKIQKGEELFTSYGCAYWLEALLKSEIAGTAVEATEMTGPILEEAKAVAKDVFDGMKSLEVTGANDAKALQIAFDS